MKYLACAVPLLFLLAGCAPPREAYRLDREFGKAQMDAWDQQIVNRESPYGATPPEGMEGITAEEVMKVYNETFTEKAKETVIPELGKKIGGGK